MLSATLMLGLMAPSTGLAEPFLAKAGGKPIKLNVGHSAPILADYDGDGKKDLLVGEFGGGGIRIYTNVGTSQEPKFDKFTMFEAGGKTVSVDFG